MNSIVFETSTIADVLAKAARVAPKENSAAFSKAPGLFIQVTDDAVIVRATDMDIFYTQWTNGIEKSPGEWEWHITSRISNFCSKLPIGSGKFVKFIEDGNNLRIQYGRSVNKSSLMRNREYPSWDAFDSDDGTVISNFSEKIDMVQWAAALASDDAIPELSGIYLDGENMVAANRIRAATVPFDFPPAKERPLTIPYKIVAPIIKQAVEVKVTPIRSGLGIEPDDYSQIMVTAYAKNPASRMKELPHEDQYNHHLEFNTEQLTDILQRMIDSVAGAERPLIKLLIANEMIALTMTGKKDETVSDALDIPGFATEHEPHLLAFNPEDFLRSISKTPGHTARLHYGSDKFHTNFIQSGTYKAWIAQKMEAV